jgi:hypothetical protein
VASSPADMESLAPAWHIARMDDAAIPHPYAIEVEREPTGFRWKIRERGELRERGQRLYPTAERAHADAVEQLRRFQHGQGRERGR